jgi:hypothetical protein
MTSVPMAASDDAPEAEQYFYPQHSRHNHRSKKRANTKPSPNDKIAITTAMS